MLVARACDGDAAAWQRLYQEHFDELFRQLRYLTGDRAVAEELAQETFAQAIASRKRCDPLRPFSKWLFGIGLNVTRKHWRKQRSAVRAQHKLAVISGGEDRRGDPHDREQARERSRMLYAVLAELPERLREAFVLRDIQGLPTSDAAEHLGISPGNLAVRATRARARIREALARRGWLGDDHGGAP